MKRKQTLRKPQEPDFINITKPGAKFESFKPNEAMQELLKQDMLKMGFVFDASGKVDINRSKLK